MHAFYILVSCNGLHAYRVATDIRMQVQTQMAMHVSERIRLGMSTHAVGSSRIVNVRGSALVLLKDGATKRGVLPRSLSSRCAFCAAQGFVCLAF